MSGWHIPHVQLAHVPVGTFTCPVSTCLVAHSRVQLAHGPDWHIPHVQLAHVPVGTFTCPVSTCLVAHSLVQLAHVQLAHAHVQLAHIQLARVPPLPCCSAVVCM